ncbi:MAG: outer membrane beta-barrel protein [Chitinophagaceae bacterium]
MERNFYTDDFERLIRQKADQYKMYPSDQVWKGVYKSLHGRKRWRWAGLAVLLLGVGAYTGNWYLSDKPTAQVARNIQPSITAANQGTPDAFKPIRSNSVNGVFGQSQANSQVTRPNSAVGYENMLLSRAGNPQNLQDTYQDVTLYSIENSAVIDNDPEQILNPDNTNNIPSVEKLSDDLNQAASLEKANESTVKANSKAMNMADAASESVLKDNEKIQNINWLQESAVFQLAAIKPKRLGLQLHFSPTVNYRKLTGSTSFTSSEEKSIPLSPNIMGDVDQYVKHKPALGFEIGANLVYRNTKRISFKAGVQFNYSRYNIEAYEGPQEIATIALSNTYAWVADTISTYSNIRNLSGYAREDLSNQYFQLSMPIGVEYKVLGSESKLQLNIAATIQPTYLLNRNSYLITTDYKGYMRQPSLVRRWNANGGLETYVSYHTGSVRWQVGPQFRYQLLSTYSRKYPIKEQLMEYGFKIGVTKTLK